MLDPVRRADERGLVDERIGHGGSRRLALAGKEQILDLGRGGLIAHALDEIVVEILVPRPHATDVERELRPDRVAADLDVVAHADAHVRRDIELGERLAGFRHALPHRIDDPFGLLG